LHQAIRSSWPAFADSRRLRDATAQVLYLQTWRTAAGLLFSSFALAGDNLIFDGFVRSFLFHSIDPARL